MAFRAYSIPVPLMGFALRGFFPRLVPYALSDAAPLRSFLLEIGNRGRSSRDSHTTRSSYAGLGISQGAAPYASMGFSAPGLLARGSEKAFVTPSHPLTRFSDTAAS